MGNITPRFNPTIVRFDHPCILAGRRDLAEMLSVQLINNSAGYVAGTVLGQITASKLWTAYVSSNTDGSQVAAAILFENADSWEFAVSGSTSFKVGVAGGKVYVDQLIGFNSNAQTNFGGRTYYSQTGRQIMIF